MVSPQEEECKGREFTGRNLTAATMQRMLSAGGIAPSDVGGDDVRVLQFTNWTLRGPSMLRWTRSESARRRHETRVAFECILGECWHLLCSFD